MSYWSHHPEKLDEITADFLPEPWKSRYEEGKIELDDIPEEVKDKAMMEGVEDYWASMADEAEYKCKNR